MVRNKRLGKLKKSRNTNSTKLSTPALIVAISLISILILTFLSGILGTSNNPCTGAGCHGSSYWQYCNLLPSDATSSLPTTFQESSGSTVKIAIEVTASSTGDYYKIDELTVTLSSLHDKVSIQNPSQKKNDLNPGHKSTFQWTVSGVESGNDELTFDLLADNSHNNEPARASTFVDSHSYDIVVQGKPDNPENLQAIAGDGYIELTWEAPTFTGGVALTGYKIYKGQITGGETLFQSVSASTTTYNDTAVTNGQTYYYYIKAENSFGESKASIEVFATPLSEKSKPLPPSNLLAKVGRDYIHLSWEEPTYDGKSPLTEYRIYRSTTSKSTLYLDSVTPPKLEYNDTAVLSGTKYYYNVTAVNVLGESDSTLEVSGRPDSEPPNIIITSPPNNTFVNSKSLFVQWTGSDSLSDIDHYEIKLDDDQYTSVGTEIKFTFLSLTEGQHKVYLKAVDGMGNENITYLTFHVDLSAPPINIISPLNNSFLDSSSVLAEWNSTDSVSGLDHFEIRMDGGTWLNMGISENHTFTSLSDGEHVFEVKAIDNTKNIMLSSVKFSIDATAPTIVDNSPTGTNIPLDTAISITFSEEMDESSVKIAVQGNEKIKQPNDDSWDVTGKITWDENVLTFTPTNDLEHTSEYTVFLIGCTDLIGHSVIAFNWSFESKVQEQITGQVIDKDGNPIPDAIIILSSGSTTSTDNEGYFTFILVPDNYELTVNKTGYTDKKLDVKLNTGELKDLGSLKIAEFEGTVDPNPDGSDGDPKDETSFLESSGGIAIAGIVIIIIVVVIILLVVFMMKKKKNEPKLPNEPRPPVPPIPPGSNI